MPSPSSLFSAYASMTASIMLFRSMANDIIPYPIRNYLVSSLGYLFKPRSQLLTLVIEESNGMVRNQVYDASEVYLCTKISPDTERLKVSKTPREKNLTIRLEKGEKIIDLFEGVELKWRFVCAEAEKGNNPNDQVVARAEKRSFELSFDKKYKGLRRQLEINKGILKMYTLSTQGYMGVMWDSINLEHPATFETLAMDPKLKNDVMEDLDRFVKRKEFFKKVGKAWKRGYLLYGPPGTGKSSLVAAMANHLKFDVYDLQLANIMGDSDLRRLLLSTGNRSILVIEDIDCSIDLPDRRHAPDGRKQPEHHIQLTLSGLLNFIDGLWSSCGDERIIIFTTNHKDRLDPALLRPGRMDMHVHMSYCNPQGFKLLASNYLGIHGYHHLFGEIESLLQDTEVSPAQVAEELMKSEDPDIALGGLVKLLKRKKLEDDGPIDKDGKTVGIREVKRQKVETKGKPVRMSRRKISPDTEMLKISKSPKDNNLTIKFAKCETMVDYFQGIELKWTYAAQRCTFETLAMDPELKIAVMEDLNRFIRRKEFYKKVGRAWKRGYLLYGPAGTAREYILGLRFETVAAIDGELLTLSRLLNFTDGLWSSCGEERIIIFTTNHKDRLDPALLRPGRMDMHIHMSYCNPQGFKLLASNYLGKQDFKTKSLLQDTDVSPAQVAEELMMSEDPDVALSGLVKLLKWKKLEGDDGNAFDNQDVKRQKVVQFNPAADLPIKLLGNVNFATWKAQLVMLLNGHQLIGHLDGSISAPPTAITQNRKAILNPKYQIWFSQNQFIQQAMMAAVDITIAPTVATAATAQKAWELLHTFYANMTE
ncbi:hypothetical protein GOBAR_AA32598 [Gossypium barbadense]|uniref:AAA+ ATPase domain-containing protein n=1 Tax=Gossypium barbadense TaxID=3634 RepID=A0A2P5WAH0_GOSBA|nr:hypothetical protein GOBAR_AA32598 [Gossypium barbadense]